MTPPPSAADEELEDVAEERPVAPPNRTLSRHEFHLVYPFKTECRDIDSLTRWENYTERLDKEKSTTHTRSCRTLAVRITTDSQMTRRTVPRCWLADTGTELVRYG